MSTCLDKCTVINEKPMKRPLATFPFFISLNNFSIISLSFYLLPIRPSFLLVSLFFLVQHCLNPLESNRSPFFINHRPTNRLTDPFIEILSFCLSIWLSCLNVCLSLSITLSLSLFRSLSQTKEQRFPFIFHRFLKINIVGWSVGRLVGY